MTKKQDREPLTFDYEKEAFPGSLFVCGTDEAGRGPLAGPVYAAAVILDTQNTPEILLSKLDDSKKLTPKKREELEELIKEHALSWSVAYSTVEEIEESDILSCSLCAMRRAISALDEKRDFTDEELNEKHLSSLGGKRMRAGAVLVDGNISRDFQIPAKAIVGGDGKSFSIAAASILAKVARDRYCTEVLDKEFPLYGFAKHKGYGTRVHYENVDKYGLCREHRRSFFKKYYDAKSKTE